MAEIKKSDEIPEYCAHGLKCNNQNTWCQRWHTGGICFFSMCYKKPEGSGYCFNGDDCELEHPTEYGGPNENLWILKNGTIFYFLDPKYELYLAAQSASKAKPEIEAKPDVKAQEPNTEHKKLTRAEKKAIRKAARKPAIEWADMEPSDESTIEFNQDAKHTTTEDVPTPPKASTGTIVDMSTKSAWAAKVKTAEQAAKQTVPVKAEQAAKQTVPVAKDFPELKSEQSKAEQSKAEQTKAKQAQDEQGKKLYMQQSIETQAQWPPDEPNAPQAEQQAEQQANENKFSSTLQHITKNFLEVNFDPVQFALLQTSLQAEFEQMTAQITLLKEQVFKLHRLQKAYAGYHSKD